MKFNRIKALVDAKGLSIEKSTEAIMTVETEYDANAPKSKVTKKSRTTKEPFSDVFKKGAFMKGSKVLVRIGGSYEADVQWNRTIEGKSEDFASLAPKGKEWVEGNEGVMMQGVADSTQYYLRTYPIKSLSSEWYYADGTPLSPEEIARLDEFLPKVYEDSGRQGTGDHKVEPRDYKIENVQDIIFK